MSNEERNELFNEFYENQGLKGLYFISQNTENKPILSASSAFNADANKPIELLSDEERLANYIRHVAPREDDLQFQTLPPFLRKIMAVANSDNMADILYLGTLAVLSSCLPGVQGSWYSEMQQCNLYFFLTGAAATGKGRMNLCSYLLNPLNDEIYRRSEEDYQAYVDGFLLQLSESKRARISLTSDIPGAPAIHRFTIPANSSAPAMYMDIASNDGNGIIFESEADTLALALGHGDFSDLLRKAYHGEPISLRRKTNQQQLFVERPYLSICLSGTPEQARTLIKSAENGLFSRFLFYRITADENYSENDLFEDGRAIQLYFTQLGEKVRDLYLKLQSRSKGVEVIFPREYLEMLKAFTDDFGTEYSNLFAKAYKTEKAVNAARSISRRMGVIVFRIAMIRTMLRYIDQDDIPSTVVCNEDDFYDTLADSSVFMQHAHVAYDEMVNKSTADIAEDSDYEFDPNSADLLTDKQRELLSLLPDSFSTQELLLLNRQLGINPRSLYRIMNALIGLGLIRRISYGHYKKHAS